MSMHIESIHFESTHFSLQGCHHADGEGVTVQFDGLTARSTAMDEALLAARRACGIARFDGPGWANIQVHGACHRQGEQARAQLLLWANGRRISLIPEQPSEPLSGGCAVPISQNGELRLVLTLLAQRDASDPYSKALCWLESLQIAVLHSQSQWAGSDWGEQALGGAMPLKELSFELPA
ncbi:hypothetical protein HNQ51_002150 [Inhella inkyongensis]|uniref:Uncharacterized protein n=1 Tax=Inhella inkyongensis TaxID=392593 RepID=A0A840S754_9BURK|nr:hypothetical protein [Inhella inkyongensis]MBB5204836.1 hypothetical protein [Inhella inkyongensis]